MWPLSWGDMSGLDTQCRHLSSPCIPVAPPQEARVAARMALATEEGALSPRASSSRLLLEFLFMLVVFDIGVQKVLAR